MKKEIIALISVLLLAGCSSGSTSSKKPDSAPVSEYQYVETLSNGKVMVEDAENKYTVTVQDNMPVDILVSDYQSEVLAGMEGISVQVDAMVPFENDEVIDNIYFVANLSLGGSSYQISWNYASKTDTVYPDPVELPEGTNDAIVGFTGEENLAKLSAEIVGKAPEIRKTAIEK